MNIEQLNPEKIKIILSCGELKKYNLDYLSISAENAATKLLVTDILIDAHDKAGFSAKECKLLIEVLPGKNNGCVLYLTKIPLDIEADQDFGKNAQTMRMSDLLPKNAGYILLCNKFDDIVNAANRFGDYPDIPLSKSVLYEMQNKYNLIFTPVNISIDKQRLNSLINTLSEYGQIQVSDNITEALLNEHGSLISENRAVEKILRYF